MRHTIFRMMTGILILALTGCASGPRPNAALEQARTAYAKARSTPDVQQYARVPLYDAERVLNKAEKAEDDEEMTRLAKLAEKQVAVAVAVAERKKAEADTQAVEQQKQKAILQARQKELDEKSRQIDKARKEVEAAQIQTQEMKREAEKARRQAEEKAREAEEKAREAALARRKADRLEQEMAELKAQKTDRGMVLTLGDVLFETGQAALMPGAMRTIDKLADFLRENPERNLVIEGHTDNVGSDEFNLKLSRRRAESVRDALLARGVGGARMITRRYGENYPVASNATAGGRQQNRRVEIIILDEGVSADSVSRP